MTFTRQLDKKLTSSQLNFYAQDNWDSLRFGEYKTRNLTASEMVRDMTKCIYRRIKGVNSSNYSQIRGYESGLEALYNQLQSPDQKILIEVLAFRLLGFEKVKLSLNTKEYWEGIEQIGKIQNNDESIVSDFMDFELKKTNLETIGFHAKLWFTKKGVYTDFCLEQYKYHSNGKEIAAKEGDIVIDAGGCWGDTAIYFACCVGEIGEVYSFEFIPGNVKLFLKNVDENPQLKDRIHLINRPLSNRSGQTLYYTDNGPASRVEAEYHPNLEGRCDTITIDDMVLEKGLRKVDFIKMDIEGMEPVALKGAINTIQRYKPKLAISIYHNWEDLSSIHIWIQSLELGYRFFLKHCTIHKEETVLFATCE